MLSLILIAATAHALRVNKHEKKDLVKFQKWATKQGKNIHTQKEHKKRLENYLSKDKKYDRIN